MVDRRLLALEITVRGEDGHNGMKSQLKGLMDRFDQFEKSYSADCHWNRTAGDRDRRGGRTEVRG